MSLFVGLDVSQEKTHISVVDENGKEQWSGKSPTSPDALAAILKERADGAVKVGMESGPLSPWLYHALKEKGLAIICVDARRAKAGLELQKVNKTDRNDAQGLARIMHSGWYQEVTVKELEGHKRQSALGVRKQLVNARTEMINQIRGILKVYGRVLPKTKLPTLKQLMLGNDLLGNAVTSLYNVLQSLSEEIKTIDRQIESFVESDPGCQVLMTIPGVGPITALAFSSSLGDPGRFKKSRSVGAYFGLTPRRYQSGEVDFSGRISKTGDMAVRSYLYEAAGVMLSRTKSFSALKAWGLRIKARSGWKKACIAVARKLAVIMHRMLLTGECFRYAKLENEKQAALPALV